MAMMVKSLMKEKRGMISAISAVVILYIFLECFGITCPIKFITGVSCAGCGMSRAWLACLRFDFKKAFYAVYLYRMIAGNNDIVVFEPQHNIIFQILKIIKK